MKLLPRIFFTFILTIISCYSFDIQTASKIYDKLLYSVFQKESIHVYSENEKYKQVIKSSKFLVLEENLKNSEIVLITNEDEINNINKDKLAFATDFNLYESYENIIGAFYWKMGRPEIVFSKKRLKKYNLNLLESFKKYAK